MKVEVFGAGLAGCEAAWQLAARGVPVRLFEMRPQQMTPAHRTPHFAELVCSNSFGSMAATSASGFLKEEMAQLGSFILQMAKQFAVPAGQALAIEREGFGKAITNAIKSHRLIEFVADEAVNINPQVPTIIATGPLTSPALCRAISELIEEKFLFFYDAISPMVEADSLDMNELFAASRYDKGDDDYLNIPLSKDLYHQLMGEILKAEKVPMKQFEEASFFEACVPMDVQAERGIETLSFGAWKPVGLFDPKTGKRPYAVIQLRRENFPTTMYSLVGCQNRLKYGEQERIFRMLPGFRDAKFLRLGSVHRNTFIQSPRLLNLDLSLRSQPNIFFAGQISGVEGYFESSSTGWMAAVSCAARLKAETMSQLSRATMLGSLLHYVSHGAPGGGVFQPMNANFGLLPAVEFTGKKLDKQARRAQQLETARQALATWIRENQKVLSFPTHLESAAKPLCGANETN